MPTITKKQLENYQRLCGNSNNDKILTPDGLRLVWNTSPNAPKTIGYHMLDTLARIKHQNRWDYNE